MKITDNFHDKQYAFNMMKKYGHDFITDEVGTKKSNNSLVIDMKKLKESEDGFYMMLSDDNMRLTIYHKRMSVSYFSSGTPLVNQVFYYNILYYPMTTTDPSVPSIKPIIVEQRPLPPIGDSYVYQKMLDELKSRLSEIRLKSRLSKIRAVVELS